MNKLQAIKQGSQIIDKIFWELLKILSAKGGSASGGKSKYKLTEVDLSREIKKLAKKLGASGMAFPPIVSFGSNSAEIHHSPSRRIIGRNNFLMLDYGVRVNGWCCDFTRTLFLGQPNKFHEKIYNLVLKAQLAALKKVKLGAHCAEVDLTARNIIAKAGLARYYNHFTGHAVGRKIHELPGFTPHSPSTLKPQTSPLVMTVEPGIYLPEKFGVRIEDMVWVGKNPRVLSQVPKDFKSMIIK
jgi:Xaa-Pro aminopeptidase